MPKIQDRSASKADVRHKVFSVIGAVLCLILIPVLIVNLTLITKSLTSPGEVPDVGGALPLIVMTDSMYPQIQSGDLIICRVEDAEEVEVGNVIAFFDPSGSGSVISHRVEEIYTEDGTLYFRTKGDANNVRDSRPVPAENLVGAFWKRVPNLGSVALFMQSSMGIVVCVVLPLVALICYDLLRRRLYEKKKQADTEALLQELKALKAEKAAREGGETVE